MLPQQIPYPPPPSHYLQDNHQVIDLNMVQKYTKTFQMFGEVIEFNQIVIPQKISPFNIVRCQQLKGMNGAITGSMLKIFKALGNPPIDDIEMNTQTRDLQSYSKTFMGLCRALKINESYKRLMERRKQDTVKINKMAEEIEGMLRYLDGKYLKNV